MSIKWKFPVCALTLWSCEGKLRKEVYCEGAVHQFAEQGVLGAWCLLNALSASERKTHTTLDKINTRVQAQKRMFPPEPFSSGQLPVLAATVKHGFIAYLNKMKLVWLENQYSWDNVYVSSMKPGIISTEVYRTIYLVLY